MSRHEVIGKDPKYIIVVGWDHPLLTFFGQVIDLDIGKEADINEDAEDADPIIHWVGTKPRELYEVEDLARAMNKYVVLDQKLRATLYGDKDIGR